MNSNLTLSSHYEHHENISVVDDLSNVESGEQFSSRFELGELIGRGSYSVVHVAVERSTGIRFACKIIDKLAVANVDRLREEIRILMSIRHENIISLHAIFETNREVLLVMDLAEGGELFDRIVEKERYSEHDAGLVVASLLHAIKFLHDQHIIHRDLKPENILLALKDSDTHIRLSDFGLAKVVEGGSSSSLTSTTPSTVGHQGGRSRAYTSCGTDYYVAPEVLRGDGYGPPVDLWSAGVILYILLSGFPPFNSDVGDMSQVYQSIQTGNYSFPSPYWDGVSEVAKDLIRRMLTVDPERRITATEALSHPWILTRSQLTTGPISPHHHAMFVKFNARRKISGGTL